MTFGGLDRWVQYIMDAHDREEYTYGADPKAVVEDTELGISDFLSSASKKCHFSALTPSSPTVP